MRIGVLLMSLLATISVAGQRCEYSIEGPTTVPPGHILVEVERSAVRLIRGTIVDELGDPVPEAIIVLSEVIRGQRVFRRASFSRGDGRFCFGNLPQGEYILEIGRSGFNTMEVTFRVRSRARDEDLRRVALEVGT